MCGDKEEKIEKKWMPRVLVIGPGGLKGLKALGFLSTIEDCGLLENTDTYCGVSAGAIISLLIVAGYQIREIVGEASNLNLFKDIDNLTVQSIIDNKGLISNEPIRRRLTQLILNKFGVVPSLWGLYMQTGKAYISVTLNATDDECEMMGPFTHPNVSCVDATMFSMNIPFIFYQLIYQGKIYVDGALGNPYPVDYFDDNKTNILGIYMKTIDNIKNLQKTKDSDESNNIIQKIEESRKNVNIPMSTYSFKIINSLMDQRRNHIIQQSSSRCKHICLETKQINVVGYNVTKEDKADMLVEGFNEGKEFISQLHNDINPKVPSKSFYSYPIYYMNGETKNNSASDNDGEAYHDFNLLSEMTRSSNTRERRY